jgi:hypothetical protein
VGQLVHVYTVRRPDRRLALLVLNLSPGQPFAASLQLNTAGGALAPGRMQEWQLSSADYRWRPRGANGAPSPDRPPLHHILNGATRTILLPPYSITVLRTMAPLPVGAGG